MYDDNVMWSRRLVVVVARMTPSTQRRSFGIFSSVADKMQTWTQDKQQRAHEDAFKKQVNDLARHEAFSYEVFYQSIKVLPTIGAHVVAC